MTNMVNEMPTQLEIVARTGLTIVMRAGFRKRWLGSLMAGSLAAALAGCTSDGLSVGSVGYAPGVLAASLPDAGADAAGGPGTGYDDNASYAGRSTYRCDSGEMIEVQNTVTKVAVAASDGSIMELPASPADSHTRYALEQYALVFDGDEALFFRPKTPPATCRR